MKPGISPSMNPDMNPGANAGMRTVAPQARYEIRRAQLADVAGIHGLLKHFSDRGVLLPRSESDLYNNVREFLVIKNRGENHGEVIACGALQIFTRQLGEVRSLAVSTQYGKLGLGHQLVRRIEQDALELGLSRLMALTYAVGFFHKLGFKTVEMKELPEKVWGACINCYKFRNCDEIAVLKTLS